MAKGNKKTPERDFREFSNLISFGYFFTNLLTAREPLDWIAMK